MITAEEAKLIADGKSSENANGRLETLDKLIQFEAEKGNYSTIVRELANESRIELQNNGFKVTNINLQDYRISWK